MNEEDDIIPPEEVCISINQFIVRGFEAELAPEYMLDIIYTSIGVWLQDKSANIPLNTSLH